MNKEVEMSEEYSHADIVEKITHTEQSLDAVEKSMENTIKTNRYFISAVVVVLLALSGAIFNLGIEGARAASDNNSRREQFAAMFGGLQATLATLQVSVVKLNEKLDSETRIIEDDIRDVNRESERRMDTHVGRDHAPNGSR